MPAHAVRRRPALPALLLTVAAAALGGLALLPARVAPSAPRPVLASSAAETATLTAASDRAAESDRAAVLARPPVLRTTVIRPSGPSAKRAASARAARSRAQLVPAGYVCPLPGTRRFSDDFGAPRTGHRHQGNDILAPYGAPVVAVISGVIQTDYSALGGISLFLHGVDGNEYFYAHNSRNVVTTGQHVSTGQVIAYVGTTGDARGGVAHVHFERHPGGGAAVDPYPFLVAACG